VRGGTGGSGGLGGSGRGKIDYTTCSGGTCIHDGSATSISSYLPVFTQAGYCTDNGSGVTAPTRRYECIADD
jgi:hypothetical protein